MGTLDGFDIEVEGAGGGVGADGSVARVGEGAGLTVAEAGDVELVPAEVLFFARSVRKTDRLTFYEIFVYRVGEVVLEFEGAELLVDDLPDDLI